MNQDEQTFYQVLKIPGEVVQWGLDEQDHIHYKTIDGKTGVVEEDSDPDTERQSLIFDLKQSIIEELVCEDLIGASDKENDPEAFISEVKREILDKL